MRRKARDRRRELFATSNGLAVAPVLGIEQELLLAVVEEAIWPSEIGSLFRPEHWFGGTLGVLLRRELTLPERVELIATVHHDIQCVVMPGDGGHLSQSGREP